MAGKRVRKKRMRAPAVLLLLVFLPDIFAPEKKGKSGGEGKRAAPAETPENGQ